MTGIVQIKYNKGFAYISMIGLLGLLIVTSLIDVKDKRGIIFGDVWIGFLLLYFIYKIFLPMLNGQVAIELTDTGIYDFIRKQQVSWDDVTQIKKVSFGKGSTGLAILITNQKEFIKSKSFIRRLICHYNNFFYYTPFIIPLQFLAGSDNEIIETVQNYFVCRKLTANNTISNSLA
jgi:hypothetical protein